MPLKLDRARRLLQAGKVVAYPTESVWGLGCDPHNGLAVEKLLSLKRRDVSKGLILVAASMEQLAVYLQGLDEQQRATLAASWPGPVTWLVPDNGHAPQWITGGQPSVALRVSAHKPVVDLCLAFGGPIVSTSANLTGHAPPRWPWLLHQQLPKLDYCLHGALGDRNKPTEIRDLLSAKVLRPA